MLAQYKVSSLLLQQLTQIHTITNCCLPLSALGSKPQVPR
jgi:hypothetical protein